MTRPDPQSLTSLLAAVSAGESGAADRLWKVAYCELRKLASARMAREAPGRTLQPTALVNEAFLRLGGKDAVCWENRRHFFGAAARAMEQVLMDYARKRNAHKRGKGGKRVPLEDVDRVLEWDPLEVIAISQALEKLERLDPDDAALVRLRYFAGLTIDETAHALGMSPRTVDDHWKACRAFLALELRKGDTKA